MIGDPVPNVPRDTVAAPLGAQTLWIDVESVMPVRWEAFAGDAGRAAAPSHRLTFDYDDSLTIERPAGVNTPDCVR